MSHLAHLMRTFLLALCTLICALLGVSAAQAQTAAPKRVALLIGNADYQTENKLRNPVRDAELLAGVLKDKLRFSDVRIERNLGIAAMDRVIDDFIQLARGADSVVFYYSGHGMKRAADDRRNFLLPVDASVGRPGSLDVERQAVDAQRLRDRLKSLGARVTLLILDACRNGPVGSKSGDKGLARMGGSNQLLVAYATEEDQVAADGSGTNSPYARALALALQRPEPLLQQLDWVADEVEKEVPGQKPTRDGNLRATAWLGSPFAPVTPDNRVSIEDEAWALCRSASGSAVACEDYLSAYPQGRYLPLARTRLRELRETQPAPQRPSPPTVSTVAAGQVVKDCDVCPELVVIPGGSFVMGLSASETGRASDERPQRAVAVKGFLLGKYEVTQGEWKAVMGSNPSGFKDCGDRCPVEEVSWNEVQEYLKRLNAKSGKAYRLASEAEWEYAARAGTTTPFSTGQTITAAQANFDGNYTYNGGPKGEYRSKTVTVGSFGANIFGLHDMHGNVWEWVQDAWHDNYSGAPSDGSAWMNGGDQSRRVLRGGSWSSTPHRLRSASRFFDAPDDRSETVGFRVARTDF
ncbi:SUMF1/EgtB/PvdO family nonheme iron enzyme [Sphaerotilus mobilis]|uniref:Formylglycine-generating enzyme required for sulfatase activity n=1 Tax=Sphaerotilus mobilis TaxID=47994 RepID=A0A4Q7LQH7_9BURK|nr:SUMF1/EgtB/PvdO family nonheme iron enzyme [Sphaerotilus mobilis]RZS57115.1 formylglycine-generating enzyme required for sulfatase activity [Sphaerotilus mobilis]